MVPPSRVPSSRADKLSALSALAAALLAAAALAVSVVSLGLGRDNEDRLDREERQQYASKVYVGEARHRKRIRKSVPGSVWPDRRFGMNINMSGVQMENVWVEGRDRRTVRMQGVQRCSMYALPATFIPVDLYFSNPVGHKWHRGEGGVLDGNFKQMPQHGTDPSPWYDAVPDCGG
jgi:predicted protein tyrosine phosphatase